jgi:hypothetical protein
VIGSQWSSICWQGDALGSLVVDAEETATVASGAVVLCVLETSVDVVGTGAVDVDVEASAVLADADVVNKLLVDVDVDSIVLDVDARSFAKPNTVTSAVNALSPPQWAAYTATVSPALLRATAYPNWV